MYEILKRGSILIVVAASASAVVASVATTDTPYLVDEGCERRPGEWAWAGEEVYVTGFFGWCSSAPGGPVSCGRDELLAGDLSVVRVGCEYPEPGRWVHDGSCGDEPRFRYEGDLSTRHSYDVRAGQPIGYLRAGGEVGECPAARPEDIWVNETTTPDGYPRAHSVVVPPESIALSVHGSMTYVTVTIADLDRYAPLVSTSQFGIDVVGVHTVQTLFGDGPIEVTLNVQRQHSRYDYDAPGGRRPRRVCREQDVETLVVRLSALGYSSPEVTEVGNVEDRDGPCTD